MGHWTKVGGHKVNVSKFLVHYRPVLNSEKVKNSERQFDFWTVHFNWPATWTGLIFYLQKIFIKTQKFNIFKFCAIPKLLEPIEKHKSQKLNDNSCHKMEYLASSDSPRENSEFCISFVMVPRTTRYELVGVFQFLLVPVRAIVVRGSLSLIMICSDSLFYRCVNWSFKFLKRAFLTL